MHGSVVRPYPLLLPIPIVVLRGGIERTTTAHATAFEGSGGSGVRGSIPEQALVTRSIHLLKEGVAGKTRACGYLAPNDPTAA